MIKLILKIEISVRRGVLEFPATPNSEDLDITEDLDSLGSLDNSEVLDNSNHNIGNLAYPGNLARTWIITFHIRKT